MREKKHNKYYTVPAYQILAGKTDVEMAKELGMCVRTYRDKVAGYSDFSTPQGQQMSKILSVSQDLLFLTK